MRGRKQVMFAVGTLLGLALGATRADADAVYTAAGACQWAESGAGGFEPAFEGEIYYTGNSGVEHRISCDMPRPNDVGATTTDDAYVYFEDNKAGANLEDSLYCNVYTCSLTGSTCYNEGTKYGCSTAGGCASHSNWTGASTIYFSDINRPAYYTTNVTCAVPNTGGGSASRVRRLWYLY